MRVVGREAHDESAIRLREEKGSSDEPPSARSPLARG